jgi:ankyrin repeat protein
MAQYNQTRQNIDPMNPRCPANQWTHHPGDEMVTLEDGRVLPIKKTICLPHGNNMVPQGKRVKLTAKLREEAEMNEELLRKAAADGAMENLKNQIEKGTNVNCRAQAAGATPLICAAVGGKLDCMKYLVEAGADPHLGNGGLASPLIVAAKWGHRDVVRWLLEDCNVDPRQWDASPAPQSPIHFAREHEDKEMEQMIAQVWARLDQFDAMKLEKKEKLEALEKEKHRKKVSREAAERRRAAEAAGTAVSVS